MSQRRSKLSSLAAIPCTLVGAQVQVFACKRFRRRSPWRVEIDHTDLFAFAQPFRRRRPIVVPLVEIWSANDLSNEQPNGQPEGELVLGRIPVLLNLQTKGGLAGANLLILVRRPIVVPPIKRGHAMDPAISNRRSRRNAETCDGFVIPMENPSEICLALAARGVTIAVDSFATTSALVGLVPLDSLVETSAVDRRLRFGIRVGYFVGLVGLSIARFGYDRLRWWAITAGIAGGVGLATATVMEVRLRKNRRRERR